MLAADPEGSGTLSLRLVQPFIRALATAGHDPAAALSGLTLDASAFTDPDGRIPHALAMQLLERAVALSGDEALGIHAAELLRPGDFDALEYVARSSGTLRGAVETVNRFMRLMHETAMGNLAREGADDVWTLKLPPFDHRVAIEFAIATMLITGRSLVGREDGPKALFLAFPAPSHTAEQERVFGCPITWNAERNALVFSPGQLDRPLAQANPALAATLQRHAEQLLSELPVSRRFATRVREHVVAALQSGEPSAEDIARRLHTSERTLRRRLKEEGTTYTDLLSDVRRELSLRYLCVEGLSVVEIAFLLGFSNASAFHRAFRRWTGMTPVEHRRRSATGAP